MTREEMDAAIVAAVGEGVVDPFERKAFIAGLRAAADIAHDTYGGESSIYSARCAQEIRIVADELEC